jgi:hypothetical protein
MKRVTPTVTRASRSPTLPLTRWLRVLKLMILRTAISSAVALCFAGSLAMADEVLYCVETDATGFRWDNQGHATHAAFNPVRFTVKITSETERIITPMTGDIAGFSDRYECKPVLSDKDEITCRDVVGGLIV